MQLFREFSPYISFALIITVIFAINPLLLMLLTGPVLLTVSSSSLSPIRLPSFHFSSICCHYSWLPTYSPTHRLRHRILATCHDIRAHAASSLLDGDGFFDELSGLLVLLPHDMRRRLETHSEVTKLIEIVMDLGRPSLARFPSGDFVLSDRAITSQDLIHATSQIGDFAADNRAGISRTLHRISTIRNRKGAIVGLTCRVGRAVQGSANMLRDLVMDGDSLLLIGPPGVGKTTIIRDIARMLADDYRKRVMIVDTSNEIGGDGDIPHTGIGNARRMQVPNSDMQHKVLIEAVENHMPQVIVIDEIGTKLEAMAASTIAQRGIQLVATAHGVTVENLIMNPSLEMLVGGIQNVTLGDEEASRRGVQKTVLERKGPSTFTRGAEIISKTEIQVHHNLESTVDALLAGRSPNYEVRKFDPNRTTYEMLPAKMEPSNELSLHVEEFVSVEENSLNNNEMVSSSNSKFSLEFAETLAERSSDAGICIRIFVYGITETSALQAIQQLGMNEAIGLTDNISEADAFLAMHSKLKKNSHIEAVAKSRGIPMHVIKTSSLMQLRKSVRSLINEHVRGFRKPEAEEVFSTLQKADFSDAISELPVSKENTSFTNKHGTGFEAPESENKPRSLEEIDALEETRLAIEEVVIPKEEQVLLLPRSSTIVSKQIKLIESYNLKWVTNGEDPHVSLCVLPFSTDKKVGKGYYVDYEGEGNDLLGTHDNSNSQNEVARLPLLPE